MSELKVDKLSPRTGTAFTLGDSGDTFTVPSGATIVNSGTATGFSAPARNFIIDGDFVLFPEGNKTAANNTYGPVLFKNRNILNENIQVDMTQSTTVPTVAQSGHQSKYSFLLSPSTAEVDLASDENNYLRYVVTGTDFGELHQQAVTLNFWVRSNTTGTYYVCFTNSAEDRSYPASYTISSADTWEEKTITLTLDVLGTWLFTEADMGLQILWMYGGGSDYEGTANVWQAGLKTSASGGADLSGSTSNNLYLSQVGLYLGTSAPSSFVGEPISTLQDQAAYYVEQLVSNAVVGQYLGSGYAWNVDNQTYPLYYRAKRTIPSGTISAAASWQITNRATSTDCASVAISGFGISNATFTTVGSSTINAFDPVLLRAKTTAASILLDARH